MSTESLSELTFPNPATNEGAHGVTTGAAATATRALLTCGLVAGPLYVAVGLFQMAIRDGFDIRRHALSLLSNGDLGWIQTTNFLVTGVLLIAGAVGLRRTLRGERGGTWGPLLIGLYGLGLIGAGFFRADPALNFPPGLPAEAYGTISTHGLLHLTVGSVGFIGFVAACFVFARRFAAQGQRGWAAYSRITGVLFSAAFVGIASGSQGPTASAFALVVTLGWAWIMALTAHFLPRQERDARA